MNILEANISDAKKYVEHSVRLINDSESDEFVFSPRKAGEFKYSQNLVEVTKKRWAKSLNEFGWERAWLIWHEDRILGHILFRTMTLSSASHRCELQMGLEKEARKKGFGTKLLDIGIKWVKDNTNIEWIDLATFESNTPAIRIYESLGFERTGLVSDSFRINDKSYNSVNMSLSIVSK